MNELIAGNAEYETIEIELIDEIRHPEISDKFDYDLVPAYFIDGARLHDGAASKEVIKRVFDTALR